MKTGQLYRTVFIDGKVENLPAQGTYFVYAGYLTALTYSNLIPDCTEKWLKEVEYYLQPVAQDDQEQSDEEIKYSIPYIPTEVEKTIRKNCNIEYSKTNGEEIVMSSLSAVMIAFEEYASHFRSDKVKMSTDEDIETWAKKIVYLKNTKTDSPIMRILYDALIEGAKAARDGRITGKKE